MYFILQLLNNRSKNNRHRNISSSVLTLNEKDKSNTESENEDHKISMRKFSSE